MRLSLARGRRERLNVLGARDAENYVFAATFLAARHFQSPLLPLSLSPVLSFSLGLSVRIKYILKAFDGHFSPAQYSPARRAVVGGLAGKRNKISRHVNEFARCRRFNLILAVSWRIFAPGAVSFFHAAA
jgi:hypothetical protein